MTATVLRAAHRSPGPDWYSNPFQIDAVHLPPCQMRQRHRCTIDIVAEFPGTTPVGLRILRAAAVPSAVLDVRSPVVRPSVRGRPSMCTDNVEFSTAAPVCDGR